MAERYVYVLNIGETASTALNYTYAQRGDAFPDKAFSNCPVNPIIKTTGTESEELGTSANFFEIRKHPGGTEPTISSDTYTQVVNRKYPATTSLSDYGKNMEQTLSYKIRTEKDGVGILLAGSDGLSPTVDLETHDWFVLINPEITGAGGIPSINPHFAKIKQLATYDKYSDGFEFEPRYTGPITKDTNYELFRGPSTSDTSVVAVSYGLRGLREDSSPDGGVTDKYDISNTASRPTWYFYEDKLEKKNQLDYNTKYLLTSCRWFSALTSRGTTSGTVPTAYGENKTLYTTADMSGYFIKGQSVWRTTDGAFIGNVANTGGSNPNWTITLDECRTTIVSSQTIAEGKTLHQTVFRTEREYGTIIKDLGRHNLDAKLIDVIYDKDTTSKDYEYNSSVTFDPTIWKDSFRNHIRQLVDRNSSNASYAPNGSYAHLTANLTGAKRSLYYKSATGKNNIVSPVIDAVSNDTISRISQNTKIKTLDHSGIQHMKLKEDQSLTIKNSVCTGGVKTLGEYELPFTATSSTVDVLGTDHYYITLNNLTEGFDYRDDSFLKLGDILRVGDYYYVISSPLIAPDTTANTQKIEVNAKKKLYDNKFATITSMESFTNSKVYVRNWKGILIDDTPIDTEVEYESNAFNRLTINGNTINKAKSSLYNTKLTLIEPQFSGIETPIDYGNSKTGLVKLQEPTKEFYKPNTTLPFLYYTTGNYTIDEDIFTGLIETTSSESTGGVLSWTIEGRDSLNSKLLTNYIVKNLEQSSDIVYSTLAPVFDTYTELTKIGNISGNVLTVSGLHTVSKYDLILNSSGELIGEAFSNSQDQSETDITLYGLTDNTVTSTVRWIKLTDLNFITATKALLSQNKSSTVYPTDLSSAGDKGVTFHDGLKLTYAGSEPTTSALAYTSSTGTSLQDNSIGYDLTGIKGISANKDSEFALKIGLEKGLETTYNTVHTVSSPSYFKIIGNARSQSGNASTLSVAPTFPVVLGSVDTNTSDARVSDINSYIYMVNRNIPAAGFIHTLKDTHTNYYTPNQTFRYLNMQENTEGTIYETHDSIYNDNNGKQKILGSAPAYRITAQGAKTAPTLTTGLTPLRESNFWTATHIGVSGRVPPIEYLDGTTVKTDTWNQLENVDYRCKNYELMAIGDIYPDSKLRHNNIGKMTDFSSFGMMLQSDGSVGSTDIQHQNYTGVTKENERNDADHERVEISGASIAPTAIKRFGIMRLVEATYDWHFNPIDYENAPPTNTMTRLTHFKYPRMKIVTATNSISSTTINGNTVFSSSIALSIGDVIYRNDGTICASCLVAGSKTTWSNSAAGSGTDLKWYGTVYTGDVLVMRQELFNMYTDPDWGLDDMEEEGIRMMNMYNGIPAIDRPGHAGTNDFRYLAFKLLEYDNVKLDAHNLWIPLFPETKIASGTDMQDFYSCYHESNMWTGSNESTSADSWYHPSRVISGICRQTLGTSNQVDMYKMGQNAHIYDNCHVLMKDFKRTTRQHMENTLITKPTSAYLELDSDTWSDFNPNISTDQHSRNLLIQRGLASSGTPSGDFNYAITGTKTKRHLLAQDSIRGADSANWGSRQPNHGYAVWGQKKGDVFQSQTFFKPKIIFPSSNNNAEFSFTMDANQKNAWLDFVPELRGYYLVSDKTTGTDYFPSSAYTGNTDRYTLEAEPLYIGKIKSHTVNVSGTHVVHTITMDTTLNTATHGTSFRLMRISETTFKDTPDYFDVNRMFDTGLKYDIISQNFITGEQDVISDGVTGESSTYSSSSNQDLIYEEGMFSMYLLLDIDNINTHIDRRTMATADDAFTNGETLTMFITDGDNEAVKTITVSTDTRLRFSYNDTLTGNGVVSFGEMFTIDTPKVTKIFRPTKAYIGTTFSVGTDIETAIEEILEENDIDIDVSEKNVTFTGNIVASTSGTAITLKSNYNTNIAVGDIIYNQGGKLIGKIKTLTNVDDEATVAVTNVDDEAADDIFYSPVNGDEITKYDRKPYIDTTLLSDDNVFNAINFLAAKRGLQYVTKEDKIVLQQLSNYKSKRTFSMRYADSPNLISVDSNTSLFDKYTKVILIGDNVKAEAKLSLPEGKQHRTLKEVNSNIKNVNEAKLEADRILEAHRYPARKVTLTMHRKGYELMKPGDIISLNFPNHGVPPDDYTVFEIENVMSSTPQITVGTFNKTIAERLAELAVKSSREQGNIHTVDLTTTISSESVDDFFDLDEQSLKYELITQSGGTTFGFV